MKKILLITLAFTMSYAINAQITAPQPSPAAKIEQKVGLTDVTLEYSRPAMRERAIFGGLVPYGKVWRTGANARTKVTFSDDVTIGGTSVKAGSYAILTIPNETKWDVIFYTDYESGGAPAELDETKVAAQVTVDVINMGMDIQSFTISFDDLTNDSGVIGILWERVYVGVKFEVPTDATVMSSIDKAMSGPSFNDYFAASGYYLNEGKDIGKAKKWIDKAMAMNDKPRFWQLRQQSLIYAKAGDKAGAIDLAKKSMAAAEEAGNSNFVKMNKASLKEWGAL